MTRWLVLAFLTVPVLEIFVIVQVGQVIGGWWTVGLLFAISLFGGWLVRHEGRRTWNALVSALGSGRVPTRELLDAAIVLVGGTLLLTPGFVTDAVGAMMLIPWTRPLSRRVVESLIARRVLAGHQVFIGHFGAGAPSEEWRGPGQGGPNGRGRPGDPGAGGAGTVIPGEVIDDDEAR